MPDELKNNTWMLPAALVGIGSFLGVLSGYGLLGVVIGGGLMAAAAFGAQALMKTTSKTKWFNPTSENTPTVAEAGNEVRIANLKAIMSDAPSVQQRATEANRSLDNTIAEFESKFAALTDEQKKTVKNVDGGRKIVLIGVKEHNEFIDRYFLDSKINISTEANVAPLAFYTAAEQSIKTRTDELKKDLKQVNRRWQGGIGATINPYADKTDVASYVKDGLEHLDFGDLATAKKHAQYLEDKYLKKNGHWFAGTWEAEAKKNAGNFVELVELIELNELIGRGKLACAKNCEAELKNPNSPLNTIKNKAEAPKETPAPQQPPVPTAEDKVAQEPAKTDVKEVAEKAASALPEKPSFQVTEANYGFDKQPASAPAKPVELNPALSPQMTP